MKTTQKPTYSQRHRNRVLERFSNDVAEHGCEILLDNGLYRHLKCSKGGSCVLGFQVITWPGYITICGDMGEYIWARTPDMFSFVRGSIDSESYFTEKLQAADTRGELEIFRDELWTELVEHLKAEHQIDVDGEAESVGHGIELLYEAGAEDAYEYASWMTDYDYSYLWCLQALKWAVQQYDEQASPR